MMNFYDSTHASCKRPDRQQKIPATRSLFGEENAGMLLARILLQPRALSVLFMPYSIDGVIEGLIG